MNRLIDEGVANRKRPHKSASAAFGSVILYFIFCRYDETDSPSELRGHEVVLNGLRHRFGAVDGVEFGDDVTHMKFYR
jgi:hypothetical protein